LAPAFFKEVFSFDLSNSCIAPERFFTLANQNHLLNRIFRIISHSFLKCSSVRKVDWDTYK
jgi:hypothetical protein